MSRTCGHAPFQDLYDFAPNFKMFTRKLENSRILLFFLFLHGLTSWWWQDNKLLTSWMTSGSPDISFKVGDDEEMHFGLQGFCGKQICIFY